MSQKGDGQVIWAHLDDILATLGAGGMSSDESELDRDERKVYYVKKMSWRGKPLTSRMVTIDKDRNFKNCYEHTSGNAPRPRKRRLHPTESSRDAIPGLPLNFYDSDWWKRLSGAQKAELRAQPPMELVEFDRN